MNRSSTRSVQSPGLQGAAQRLRVAAHNAIARVPGTRPKEVAIDLAGSFPARRMPAPAFYGIPLRSLGAQEMSLQELADITDALSRAPWIERVVFRIHRLTVNHATAYALRRAIRLLRDRGKRTLVYITRFTEPAYAVAAAADEVVAPESAEVCLYGFGLTVPLLGDALARFGLRFDRFSAGDNKHALEELVSTHLADEHRKQLACILAAIEAMYVEQIADDRRLSRDAVRNAFQEGITSAARLAELGFIDRVAYEDEVIQPDPMPIKEAYRLLPLHQTTRVERIGVISASGLIVPGVSRRVAHHPALCGAETLTKAFREARKDKRTVALVLHIDSPGGSALASDLIWREVKRSERPVVAALGSVAASGGYYIATAARHVVTTPATIVGSIGAVAGRLSIDKLLERFGVHTELLQTSPYTHIGNPLHALTDDEKDHLQRSAHEVHMRFASRVAEGRRLEGDRLDELTRGDIWLGDEAVRRGLADELGDIERAIERAAHFAGIDRDAQVWDIRP
jgi:protease-4